MSIEYERENERVVVAMRDGEEIARIVEVPGGATSYRLNDGSKRGGRVDDIDEAKKNIESYLK